MRIKKLFLTGALLAFVIIMGLFLGLSLGCSHDFFSLGKEVRQIEKIQYTIGDFTEEISLPHVIKNVAPGSLVVLQGEIDIEGGESLLVTSHFSSGTIYLDDEQVYEFWPRGSYPSFMKDPLFASVMIPLPEYSGTVKLRMELTSPLQRNELSLPAIYAGREGALISMLFWEKGPTLLFSLILIVFGILLPLVWTVFLRKTPSGASFLWLGMFSLSAGAWVLGECELSGFLIPYPFFLYVIDYLGMFCVCIPLMGFWVSHPQAQVKKPLEMMLVLHYASVLGAVVLQLTGTVDLMKTLYWFHIISPLAFVVLAAVLLWEYFYCRNRTAKYFAPAGFLLAVFVVLELMNYWFGMSYSFTALFQVGLLAFIVWLGFISGYFVRQSARTAFEKEQLEYELRAMSRQLTLQQEQYENIMENAHAVKTLRHDMRHHIAVIKGLAQDQGSLSRYVDNLEQFFPDRKEKNYCINSAVNAVVSHYLGIAEGEGIRVKTKLDIPEDLGRIPPMDICIVMGNLLENALEACRRLEEGTAFIHARSMVRGDTLSIVIHNSYDGIYERYEGLYLSRKKQSEPGRTGVGLSSVKAICEKYDGILQWETEENIWKTSLLLHMDEINQEN